MSAAARRALERLWRGEAGPAGAVAERALAPAAWLYGRGMALRNRAYDRGWLASHAVPIPVVSVGNIAVGGAGKTPVAAWLVERLLEMGHHPALLHGGYAPDEPELHRLWLPGVPVIAERDRVAASRRAAEGGATVIVLDDAFQHRRIARDLDIALVAAERWTGTKQLLPRGPWRESPVALRRADLVLVTRKVAPAGQALAVAEAVATVAPHVSVANVALRPGGWRRCGVAAAPPRGPVLAVAGIAEPDLFFENVVEGGASAATLLRFPDHHPYDVADAERIRATGAGRPVVTTAKDWVKLRTLLPETDVWVLEQRVIVESGAAAVTAALERLGP